MHAPPPPPGAGSAALEGGPEDTSVDASRLPDLDELLASDEEMEDRSADASRLSDLDDFWASDVEMEDKSDLEESVFGDLSDVDSDEEPPLPPPGAAPLPLAPTAASSGVTVAAPVAAFSEPPQAPALCDTDSAALVVAPFSSGQLAEAHKDEASAAATDIVCVAPTFVGGTDRFATWVRSLPIADLARFTKSYEAWKQAEKAWLQTWQKKRRAPERFSMRLSSAASKLTLRVASGCKYDEWLRGEGAKSRSPLLDFVRLVHPELPANVPKKHRVWLASCLKQWRQREMDEKGTAGASLGARKPTPTRGRVPDILLLRARGLHGALLQEP